jgi:hypothetical protein
VAGHQRTVGACCGSTEYAEDGSAAAAVKAADEDEDVRFGLDVSLKNEGLQIRKLGGFDTNANLGCAKSTRSVLDERRRRGCKARAMVIQL